MAPHVIVTTPDLEMVDDAMHVVQEQDAKRPETKALAGSGSEDVISLGDSESAVATPTTDFDASPDQAPGLGLYDESRKDQ